MQERWPEPGMTSVALTERVLGALDALKAQSVKRMDVRHLTSVTDVMIVATGRSGQSPNVRSTRPQKASQSNWPA